MLIRFFLHFFQIILKQLKDKLEDTKDQITIKSSESKTNETQLFDLKSQLQELINSCEELYNYYDTQRNQVIEIKINRKNESYTAAWVDSSDTNSWPVNNTAVSPEKTTITNNVTIGGGDPAQYHKYRALYEFFGRNEDELTFQPGDLIMVPINIQNEPGWLTGQLNGLQGWFPETYVEKIESPSDDGGYGQQAIDILDTKRQLE